jgi:hypothetical protein
MPMQFANIIRVTDSKLIASVTSSEALNAVWRLFRGEPIMAMSIPFVQPMGVPRKNVLLLNLKDGP